MGEEFSIITDEETCCQQRLGDDDDNDEDNNDNMDSDRDLVVDCQMSFVSMGAD